MTASPPASLVEVERYDRLAVISLNDPVTLNAASAAMAGDLAAALDRADRDTRCIVLTGRGRAFCSGANLRTALDPGAEDYDAGALLEARFNPLMKRMRSLSVPVVTAVNGAAAGIGAALALSGDLIVAARSAYFLQAFGRVGLVPDGGSASLLVHAAGRARASEMMLLGERVGAEAALDWGMINRVVDDDALLSTAMDLGHRLAAGPWSLGAIRRLAWEAADQGYEEMLERERWLQRDAGRTGDHREGVAAFLAKRSPAFRGN